MCQYNNSTTENKIRLKFKTAVAFEADETCTTSVEAAWHVKPLNVSKLMF